MANLVKNITASILDKIFQNKLNWKDFATEKLNIEAFKKCQQDYKSTTTKSPRHSSPINNNNNITFYSLTEIQIFLQFSHDPNLLCLEGKNILHLACENQRFELVQLLLTHKEVDVNFRDFNQQTALHYVAINGNTKIVDLLLQHNAFIDIIDFDKKSPLFYAVNNHPLVFQQLLDHITQSNQLKIVDRFGKCLLQYTTLNNNTKATELILNKIDSLSEQNDIKSTPNNETKLQHKKVIDFLIKYTKLDFLKSKQSPLHTAIQQQPRNLEIIQLLIKYVDINSVDNQHQTALHYAFQTQNLNAAQLLIESGANYSIQNDKGLVDFFN